MSSVEKLESWQAFILPQPELNNKCRKVDMRGGQSYEGRTIHCTRLQCCFENTIIVDTALSKQ